MGMECIILCGGLGTRLRSVVPDTPKCMAEVAGKPFIEHVTEGLMRAGFDHIIYSLGYKSECFLEWMEGYRSRMAEGGGAILEAVVEPEPLGTGGAIRFAARAAKDDTFFVLNGDSYLLVDYRAMLGFHRLNAGNGALATLALKKMYDFDRYGVVSVGNAVKNSGGVILSFGEKAPCREGLINAGVYILQREALGLIPEKGSLEREFFERQVDSGSLFGYIGNGFFIDIGIPDDYAEAQRAFSQGLHLPFDTLLLDRDGVIDVELKNDYVRNPGMMEFIPGALGAIAQLNGYFRRTVVVTNQRGVGRGLMTLADLEEVHGYMNSCVEAAGGRIDKIYFSTGVDLDDPLRKPNPGMAALVKADFPQADFGRSLMVGDQPTDMEFASRAGIHAVMVDKDYTLSSLAGDIAAICRGEEPSRPLPLEASL